MKRENRYSEIGLFLRKIQIIATALVSIGVSAQSPFQNCLVLNGHDNYIRIQPPVVLDSTGQYTIEFWAMANSGKPGNLMNKWVSARNGVGYNASNQGWSIDLNTAGGYASSSEAMLDAWSEPGAIRLISSFTNPDGSGGDKSNGVVGVFEIGRWYHFSVVLTRLSMLVYINGNNTYQGGRNQAAMGYPLFVGGFPPDIDSTLYLDGSIDELRIWNRTRSWEQLMAAMHDTLNLIDYSDPDSGLVGYYRFDQFENLGVGGDSLSDDIRDLSVYANHADIVGSPQLSGSTAMADKFTGVENFRGLPFSFDMLRNYPNPFNPITTIRFELPTSESVRLNVFNVLGKKIETLVNSEFSKGIHEVTWNAANRPAGIYFCRLETRRQLKTIKMLLQK